MRHRMPQATYPGAARAAPLLPYLVLLRVGFSIAAECCHRRGALLPHHFTLTGPERLRRYTFCCTFRRLTPPRRYLALCPMEPGLSSRKRGRSQLRKLTPTPFPSDCLADSEAQSNGPGFPPPAIAGDFYLIYRVPVYTGHSSCHP